MDEARLDHLARSLRSRRKMLVSMLSGGVASALARPAPAGAVACLGNGEPCDPGAPTACCSGACKKHNGQHTCAPAGQSFGCGKRKALDFCRNGGNSKDCPRVPDGNGFCASSQTKRAICVVDIVCVTCQSDDDCVAVISDPAARCIPKCAACSPDSTTACILPLVVS